MKLNLKKIFKKTDSADSCKVAEVFVSLVATVDMMGTTVISGNTKTCSKLIQKDAEPQK